MSKKICDVNSIVKKDKLKAKIRPEIQMFGAILFPERNLI
jgi:hypothetical protein